MNVDDVFALLLLVVPGFVVIEVSNAITPRQSMRRSDREKLSGMLMGGLAVFACYLALRGYANVRAGLDSLSPTSAGWPEFGLLFGITVALGLAWGLLKSRLVPTGYRAVSCLFRKCGLPSYNGARRVWDDVSDAMRGNYVKVFTTDGRVYYGHRQHVGDLEGDAGLSLIDPEWAWAPERGHTVERCWNSLPGGTLVYLPQSSIHHLQVIPPGE